MNKINNNFTKDEFFTNYVLQKDKVSGELQRKGIHINKAERQGIREYQVQNQGIRMIKLQRQSQDE
jgi:hypothetical protein